MTDVSIVIPTQNERAHIAPLLHDLRRQTLPPREILVIDGGSTDGTPEMAAAVPGVRVLAMAPSLGRQRQRGLDEARGEIVVFLDADVRVPETFLERALAQMRRRRLRAACPCYWPRPSTLPIQAIFAFFNALFVLLQWVLPSGAGMGILVEREFALRAGGVRGDLRYDDIEFIRRLGRRGRFGMLWLLLFVSDRRFRTEGVLPLLGKYLLLSILFTFGLFRLAHAVGYRFGHHRADRSEQVVLVDDSDTPIGIAPKATVHAATTPLHRAFSVFLFNERGEVLLQQRALTKKTWPGVWSNSCCGHPAPGEAYGDAARRRLREELGIVEATLFPGLPEFRYQAELDGIQEREICPVFLAYTTNDPILNPDEVAASAWVEWGNFLRVIGEDPASISPWCRQEAMLLAERYGDGICTAPSVTSAG